jgi:hypothetical protein
MMDRFRYADLWGLIRRVTLRAGSNWSLLGTAGPPYEVHPTFEPSAERQKVFDDLMIASEQNTQGLF